MPQSATVRHRLGPIFFSNSQLGFLGQNISEAQGIFFCTVKASCQFHKSVSRKGVHWVDAYSACLSLGLPNESHVWQSSSISGLKRFAIWFLRLPFPQNFVELKMRWLLQCLALFSLDYESHLVKGWPWYWSLIAGDCDDHPVNWTHHDFDDDNQHENARIVIEMATSKNPVEVVPEHRNWRCPLLQRIDHVTQQPWSRPTVPWSV